MASDAFGRPMGIRIPRPRRIASEANAHLPRGNLSARIAVDDNGLSFGSLTSFLRCFVLFPCLLDDLSRLRAMSGFEILNPLTIL